MSHYSLEQAIKLIAAIAQPFDMPQIADLCRQGKLTPLFPYDGYISMPVGYDDNGRPIHALGAIEPYSGNLHSSELIKLIDGYVDSLKLWTASTQQGVQDLDFYSRPMRHIDDEIEPITFTVTLKNILLAADQVHSCIDDMKAKHASFEQFRILELESLLAQAKAANDDKELTHKSQEAVTRLLNVLFHKAELNIEAHDGTTNKNIYDYSRHPSIETPITKGFISDWIKRVQQLRIDTKEKQNRGTHDGHMP